MATLACQECGAALDFGGLASTRCPYCASPNIADRPTSGSRVEPTLVVAFGHGEPRARQFLGDWLGRRRWFVDARVQRAQIAGLRGIYVPAYLYSAVARTSYSASIGENYTETEEVEVRDADGKTRKETRTVVRTEYCPLSGQHVCYLTDVVVSGSAGLADDELQRIEPFDLRALRRHDASIISGWLAEEFARAPSDAATRSRVEASAVIGGKLKRFMPGDSHADLAYETRFSWESFEPVLIPIWVGAARYRDDKPALRVVINGQTGAIHGKLPLSPWRIAIAIVVPLAILAGVLWWWHSHHGGM